MKTPPRSVSALCALCALIAVLGLGIVFSIFSSTIIAHRYVGGILAPVTFSYQISVDDLQPFYTEKQARILAGSATDYLSLAAAHPDTPWYSWQALQHSFLEDKTIKIREIRKNPISPGHRALAQTVRNAVTRLGPEASKNGWAMCFAAYLEALDAIELDGESAGQTPTGRVVDPDAVSRAAALIAEAVRSERFTTERAAAVADWRRILAAPKTFDTYMAVQNRIQFQSVQPFLAATPLRDLAYRMGVEAARLAALPDAEDAGGSAAFRLLHDLQTMGARVSLDAPVPIGLVVGYSIVEYATEYGYAVLRDANRGDEADRLLQRGRALLHSWKVHRSMGWPASATEPEELFWNDPALSAEAEKEARNWQEKRDAHPDLLILDILAERQGFVASSAIGSADLHRLDAPERLVDSVRVAGRFEHWGWQKVFWMPVTVLLSVALLGLTLLVVLSIHRQREGADEFPEQFGRTGPWLRSAALFGCVAIVPALAAVAAGNILDTYHYHYLAWILFWNAWGLVAAFWCLGVRANGSILVRRIAPVLLVLAILSAVVAYSTIWNEYAGMRRFSFKTAGEWLRYYRDWFVAALFLAAAVLSIIVSAVRNFRRSPAPGVATLWLAGVAGGIVLSLASFFFIASRERAWAQSDKWVMLMNPALLDMPVRDEIARLYAAEMREILEKTSFPDNR